MPDISMCSGNNCNLKENCYRHKATPTPYRQSYFSISPLEEDGSCKFFWKYEEEPKEDSSDLFDEEYD